jgi:uncharacterized protein
VTPWNTWISCEETLVEGHGWNFEVGTFTGNPKPIKEMGRFSHEALMVDPRTGYVYETEDSDRAGFFKFVANPRGKLQGGGRLYMLKIWNEDGVDLGGAFEPGTTWNTSWVRIDDPTAASKSCFQQGFEKGGAVFRRLEGAADQIAAAGKSVAPGNFTQQEWAGACFSPDGRWLFVNIQTPGITFAITGPWHKGPL